MKCYALLTLMNELNKQFSIFSAMHVSVLMAECTKTAELV